MSCPDWLRLVRVQDEDPESWQAALQHAEDCDDCFEDALEAEPTMLFRRLPAPRASQLDIEAIKSGVASMRRAQALTRPAETRRKVRWGRSLATAATLLLAAVLSGGWPGDRDDGPMALVEASQLEESLAPTLLETPSEVDQMPLVEDVDPTYGSVVQVMDAEMSLVLVLPNGDMS